MVITSIIPCIKVIKENDFGGIDMYIEEGKNIKITDNDGRTYIGKFSYIELGKDVDEDDIISIMRDDNSFLDIGVSYIKDIENM